MAVPAQLRLHAFRAICLMEISGPLTVMLNAMYLLALHVIVGI